MIGLKKALGFWGASVIVSLMAASASASLLDTGVAYNDGIKTWQGTKAFSKAVTGGTLAGYVDWAVFASDDFESLFSGYTPIAGHLVYTYQVFNTGTVDISLTELPLLSAAPADTPGWFTGNGVSGQDPYDALLGASIVTWDFRDPNNIVYPGNSAGLAVGSIRKPRTEWTVVVDGGGSVNVIGPAGPGTVDIPEPSTLTLLVVAAAVLGIVAAARKRR